MYLVEHEQQNKSYANLFKERTFLKTENCKKKLMFTLTELLIACCTRDIRCYVGEDLLNNSPIPRKSPETVSNQSCANTKVMT